MSTLPKMLQQHGIAAVPHGFRLSFRRRAAEETDHSREVIEAALAHVAQTRPRMPGRICSSGAGGSWTIAGPGCRNSGRCALHCARGATAPARSGAPHVMRVKSPVVPAP